MKAIITIIVLAIIAWAGYAILNNDESAVVNPGTNAGVTYVTPSVATSTPATTASTTSSAVKEFKVSAQNFSFSPSTMTVNKGDRVRIVFQDSGGNHDWVIDAFNARTAVLSTGQSQTIEFTADKTGSFEYYCSVGTHRQMGMKGTLTVK
jgi:plastocyanin